MNVNVFARYVIGMIFGQIFLNWWIDKPQEWSVTITILSSLFACASAYSQLEDNHGSKSEIRATGTIIIIFWMIVTLKDFFDINDDFGEKLFFTLLLNWENIIHIIMAYFCFFPCADQEIEKQQKRIAEWNKKTEDEKNNLPPKK